MSRYDRNIGGLDVEDAATEAVATLKRNYGYYGGWYRDHVADENMDLWGVWKIEQMGSYYYDLTNGRYIAETLRSWEGEEVFFDDDDSPEEVLIKVFRVAPHTCKIYDEDIYGGVLDAAETTEVFDRAHDLAVDMERYPVLDDDAVYELQQERQRKNFNQAWRDVDWNIEPSSVADPNFKENEEVRDRIYALLQGYDDEDKCYNGDAHSCFEEYDHEGDYYIDVEEHILPVMEELGLIVSERGPYGLEYKLPEPLEPIEQGHLDAIRLGLQQALPLFDEEVS